MNQKHLMKWVALVEILFLGCPFKLMAQDLFGLIPSSDPAASASGTASNISPNIAGKPLTPLGNNIHLGQLACWSSLTEEGSLALLGNMSMEPTTTSGVNARACIHACKYPDWGGGPTLTRIGSGQSGDYCNAFQLRAAAAGEEHIASVAFSYAATACWVACAAGLMTGAIGGATELISGTEGKLANVATKAKGINMSSIVSPAMDLSVAACAVLGMTAESLQAVEVADQSSLYPVPDPSSTTPVSEASPTDNPFQSVSAGGGGLIAAGISAYFNSGGAGSRSLSRITTGTAACVAAGIFQAIATQNSNQFRQACKDANTDCCTIYKLNNSSPNSLRGTPFDPVGGCGIQSSSRNNLSGSDSRNLASNSIFSINFFANSINRGIPKIAAVAYSYFSSALAYGAETAPQGTQGANQAIKEYIRNHFGEILRSPNVSPRVAELLSKMPNLEASLDTLERSGVDVDGLAEKIRNGTSPSAAILEVLPDNLAAKVKNQISNADEIAKNNPNLGTYKISDGALANPVNNGPLSKGQNVPTSVAGRDPNVRSAFSLSVRSTIEEIYHPRWEGNIFEIVSQKLGKVQAQSRVQE